MLLKQCSGDLFGDLSRIFFEHVQRHNVVRDADPNNEHLIAHTAEDTSIVLTGESFVANAFELRSMAPAV